jgi:PP-loop superfamily ATP-utilizing enzyme
MTIYPNLKSSKKTCETLDISRESLHHIVHLNQIGKYAHSETQRFNEMCLRFNLRKQEVSQSARNMVCWKRDKPKLLKQLEQAKKRLQLDLFDDD